MIQEIIDNAKKPDFSRRRNLDICVKIPYRGYEISVATDARSDLDDFTGDGIRIYLDDKNVTHTLLPVQPHLSGSEATGDMLKLAFAKIDEQLDK